MFDIISIICAAPHLAMNDPRQLLHHFHSSGIVSDAEMKRCLEIHDAARGQKWGLNSAMIYVFVGYDNLAAAAEYFKYPFMTFSHRNYPLDNNMEFIFATLLSLAASNKSEKVRATPKKVESDFDLNSFVIIF